MRLKNMAGELATHRIEGVMQDDPDKDHHANVMIVQKRLKTSRRLTVAGEP